jgi:hypothetical protein
MNIYLLTPSWKKRKHKPKWDYYASAVVVAESVEDALSIHPDFDNKTGLNPPDCDDGSWPPKGHVFAEVLGIADRRQQRGVVCASFNAG